jgi:outer membrane protein assembly factor BamB
MFRNRRRPGSPTRARARTRAGTLTGLAVGGAALTAIVAPLAFGSPGGGSPWSQFGHDSAHSGVSNTEQALTPSNVNQLRSLFSAQLPGTADGPVTYLPGVPTPAGGKDLVFTTSRDGWITAVDARTGGAVWSHQNGPGNCHVNNGGSPCYITSTPAVDPGNQFVYAYGLDGKVHKYAVGNGAETIGGGWPQVATLKRL